MQVGVMLGAARGMDLLQKISPGEEETEEDKKNKSEAKG